MKTKTAHTPGPWTWNGSYFIADDGTEILCGKKTNKLKNKQEANAHLIAAVPELFEAAKLALSNMESLLLDDETSVQTMSLLRKSIAKVENQNGDA